VVQKYLPFLILKTSLISNSMEVVLSYLDPILLDPIYESAGQLMLSICMTGEVKYRSSISATIAQGAKEKLCFLATDRDAWQRQSSPRQALSIFFLTWHVIIYPQSNSSNANHVRFLSSFFYLLFGTICYYQNFDRSLRKHPKFCQNQIRSEIADSLFTLFGLNVLTVPIFLAQVRNLSKIYKFGSGSLWYEIAQYPFFVLFSDTGMYWLHRVFHHPLLFKICHSQHHQ